MVIEIKGGGFVNKGAQLMLYAVLSKQKIFNPNSRFIMHMMSGSFSDRSSYEIGHLAWLHTWNYRLAATLIDKLFSSLPNIIRKKYDIWLKKEIQVIFDISGFIYSDEFGEKPCKRMAEYYKKMKKNGVKIILMPQAMGPFHNLNIKKYVSEIIISSDLIYIRDYDSLKYVNNLIGNSDKLIYAPDFTYCLEGIKKNKYLKLKNKVGIIPNEKLFRSDNFNKSNYISLLNSILSYCEENDISAFLLLHEYDKDSYFLDDFKDKIKKNIDIVTENDPLVLKSIIGNSKLIISSRYHGLINALYQCVPVIATGWCHKYEALMNEYNLEDYMVKEYDSNLITKMMRNIFEKSELNIIRYKILLENKKREQILNDMWGKIENLIKT